MDTRRFLGPALAALLIIGFSTRGANSPPTANPNSYTVNEDTTLTVSAPGVLGNDSDPEGAALKAILVSNPTNGTLSFNTNGSFVYRANTNYNGVDRFTYKANDGTNDSAAATVTITITSVNDAPVAYQDMYSVNEDTTLTVAAPGVLGNDIDVDGDAMTALLVSGTTRGTLSFTSNGAFTYRPNTNYNGLDSFTYKTRDASSTSAPVVVAITVNPVNDSPLATNDSYSVNAGSTLNVSAPGVLANDGDVDGDILTAVAVSNPTHGALSLNADGSFSYTPVDGYYGSDVFTYRAADAQSTSAVAQVAITVNPTNVPVACSIVGPGIVCVSSLGNVFSAPTGLPGYAWTISGNGTMSGSAAGSNVTVNAGASGFFTLNLAFTNIIGTVSNCSRVISVSRPSATVSGSATICGGDSMLIQAALTGVSPWTLVWSDGFVQTNVTTNVSSRLVTPAANTTYSVTSVSDALCAGTTSGSAVIALNSAPTVTLNPIDRSVCAGASVTLSSVAVGNPAPAMRWQVSTNGGMTWTNLWPVAAASTSNYTFTVAAADNGKYYRALFTNICGTVTNASVLLRVGTTATPLSDENVCPGSDVSFSTAASGVGPFRFQWRKDNVAIAGATNSFLTLPGVTAATTGLYSVVITGACNVVTQSATLNVSTTVAAKPLSNLVRFIGGIAVFDGAGMSAGPFTYQWCKEGVPLANETNSSLTLSNLVTGDSGDYEVVVSSACGSATNSAMLSVAPCFAELDVMLVIDRTGTMSGQPYTDARTACTNFIRNLKLGATNDQVGLVSYNPTATLNETLTTNGLMAEAAVSALGPATNGTCIGCGLIAAQAELTSERRRPNALPVLVLLSDGIPHDFDTPSNALYLASQAKNAGTRVFTIGLGEVDHEFMAGMASSTNDYFFASNSSELDGLFEAISRIICRPPTNIFGPSDTVVCSGATVTLDVVASGCSSFAYQWRKGGAPIDGETNNSITLSNLVGADSGIYSVVVSGSCKTVTNSATLTVNEPALVVTPPADQIGFVGSNVLFSVGATGTRLRYQWYFNDVLVGTSSTLALNNLTTNRAGNYCVVVASADCGDPVTNCAVLTIENRAPRALDDSYTVGEDTTLGIAAPGLLVNDSDVDGDSIGAVLVSDPAHGLLNFSVNGAFTYTPSLNYTGVDTFTYRVTDGSLSSEPATVTITVTPVNDPPVAMDDFYIMEEDGMLIISAPGVLANDIDVDGDVLRAVLVSNPAHGTLSLGANGAFAYMPSLNYTGLDTFTYRTTDGTLDSGIATVTISITPLNDAPVANNDAYSTAEDTVLTVPAAGVLANDTDVDGDPLAAIVVGNPSHGNLNLSASGAFVYTPSLNYTGIDTFTYRASDSQATSALATVTITITPVNDAPVAGHDFYEVEEGETLTVPAPGVMTNDFDVDGDRLTTMLITGPAHGSLNLNTNGAFVYTPSLNYTGVDTFIYRVTDGLLTSEPATVTIEIGPVNDAPVASNDAYSIIEDTALTVAAPGVLANDTDVDGDPLLVFVVNNPIHGTLNLNTNGAFVYAPSLNYTGVDTFTYRATDGALTSDVATVTITITPVNDTPVANNDAYTIAEDTTLTVAAPGVLANDSDVDGDVLTTVLVSGVAHGTLNLSANGVFTYTPSLNYTGVDTFTYRASDGQATSALATVTITITPVNDAPVAGNDAYTTPEDTALTIAARGVLANDTDVDGDVLSALLLGSPAHGTVSLSANGAFVYTPSLNYTGLDTFTYRATDGQATSALATVTITITPVNDTPVANNDAYTIAEDTALTIAAPGVLANDSDVDGDTLTTVLVSGVTHGTLNLSANGAFVYTPSLNYTGVDTFTYRATDGQATSALATVTITITPVNDAPVAGNDAYSTAEDAALSIAAPGVLANDSDVDGDVLTTVLVSSVTHGTLNLNANGAFVYTPSLNYTGVDTFTYRASDGQATSALATVTITITPVNDVPVANNDAYTTAEDTALTIAAPGVLANDTDVDGDVLSALLLGNPGHGTVSLSANGAFVYTPSLNYTGLDTFTYRASDGALTSSVATVSITITPVNDVPVASNDAYTIAEDTTLTIGAAGILGNDVDVDGDVLTTVLVSSVTHGTLNLSANGAFVYTPSLNYTGVDTFTYRASDGQATSALATVTITITPVNDTPVANNDAYTTAEDTALTIAAPGVLANDSDVDGDVLTTVLVSGVTHGTLNLSANGAFVYTPSLNYTGVDTFTYRASDGQTSSPLATVTITITPVNDTPVANNDAYTIAEDTTLTITAPGVLANDSDVDGDVLTTALVSGVTHGTLNLSANGAFVYTPSLNYTGVDTFTYRATDGQTSSPLATVTITITPVNDTPVASNDAYSTAEDTALSITAPGVLANDSDVDGDVLTTALVSGVTHGTLNLNANGAFNYTPSLNYTGLDTFTYRATDGQATSALATVTITITPVNDTPVANNDAYTIAEDTALTIAAPGVLANDSDVDGDTLTTVLVSGVTHGTLNLSANGAFVYTPSLNYTGLDTFTYRASDGQTSSPLATVTITITPVNDTPVANNDAYTTAEDTTLTISAAGILANDSDVDGDVLTAVLVSGVAHGTLNLSANGAFTYTPSLNYTGVDTFTYRATDGQTSSPLATVTITITPVNDTPVASNDAYTIAEDTTLTIAALGVLANDSDVDGDVLTTVLVSGVTHGTLNLSANGAFTYTPSLNYTGVDTFTYRATDGQATSALATVTITITPVNDRPTAGAAGDAYSVLEDGTLTVAAPGVLANDTDVDGDPLSAVLLSNPQHGTVTLHGNGSFTYLPATNYFGADSFTYAANDGQTNSAPSVVTITVTPVNDVPSFTAGANQRVNFNAGPQTVLAWATGMSAGPANESGQSLNFIMANDNPSLFSAQPAVSPNGTLTYTPAGGLFGVATVTVTLKDNGGTENGGADSSASKTFTITLNGPPMVSIVNPNNGAVYVGTNTITVVAEASDPDSVVTNLQVFLGTNVIGTFTTTPGFVTLTNMLPATNAYQFRAIVTDDLGLRATSSVVSVTVTQSPPVSALGPIALNRQNGLFEQYARIMNPTPRSFPNGVRLYVMNLDTTNKVYNATGTNASGVPYIDVHQPLPSGGWVDVLIQYYIPNERSVPSPTLVAEPLPFTVPSIPPPVLSNTGRSEAGIILSFATAENRLYYLQSSTDLAHWNTMAGLITGTGGVVTRTNSFTDLRFYRVLMLP